MKVTGIRTIRLPEHPQMLWLQVLTDEGLTGLGETCLGPATVEAHLHETVAPYLIGQDPQPDRRAPPRAVRRVRRLRGHRGRDPR